MFKCSVFIFLLSFSICSQAQLQNLSGNVTADGEVEGIHVLNKTSVKYTITNTDGSFVIPVKLNDTLVFSALKYNIKEVVISQKTLSKLDLKVTLTDKVNELDEVVVGRILTGNLGSDLTNTQIEKPINFYDLGIKGSKKLPKTLNERKLYAATSSSGGIPLIGLINAITGKTKELRERVELDKDIACVNRLRSEYQAVVVNNEDFSEVLKERFFSFILDSEKLRTTCRSGSEFSKIEFLKAELQLFKSRIAENDKKD